MDSKVEKNSSNHNSWLIVGFDPGLTSAVAILDLNGNILYLNSFKEVQRSKIINEIINHGRVTLVATDVYPHPKMVKKLASTLNSKIYSPPKVLTVESKNELVYEFINERKFNISPENAHQRDALAAAIKTYKHYEKKFKQIEKRADEKKLNNNQKDEIKNLVIKGTPITKAINLFLDAFVTNNISESIVPKEKPREDILELNISKEYKTPFLQDESILKLKRRLKSQDKHLKTQRAIIKSVKDKNKILKTKIRKQKLENIKLKNKISKLEKEYSDGVLHNKEILSKIKTINSLKAKYNHEKRRTKQLEENLQSMGKIRNMELSDQFLPVKIVKSFTREGINRACEYWKIKKGDVILLASSRGGGSQTALLIVKMKVKAVLINDPMSHQASEVLENNNIPVLSADEMHLKKVDKFAIVKSKTLNNQIDKWKNNINDQRKKEEKQKLLNVIEEYKAQRKRETRDE
ncbi:DUF460 domain-containing protein [Methanobacterium alcaliphilum]|uniref:DUF460 domain-containing protein n=1 Tax=Methanobacterium alcaliphilum TaxID=392018 RepID=UPI00200B9D8D|nr:DUF460 domain-containing protein [Methanobacterium alcaliphilum]MCK9150905.1 DUF460 domain-containing protein [Methanobacterium alcaliphilum]